MHNCLQKERRGDFLLPKITAKHIINIDTYKHKGCVICPSGNIGKLYILFNNLKIPIKCSYNNSHLTLILLIFRAHHAGSKLIIIPCITTKMLIVFDVAYKVSVCHRSFVIVKNLSSCIKSDECVCI